MAPVSVANLVHSVFLPPVKYFLRVRGAEEGRKCLRNRGTLSLSTHENVKWEIKNERLHFTRKDI